MGVFVDVSVQASEHGHPEIAGKILNVISHQVDPDWGDEPWTRTRKFDREKAIAEIKFAAGEHAAAMLQIKEAAENAAKYDKLYPESAVEIAVKHGDVDGGIVAAKTLSGWRAASVLEALAYYLAKGEKRTQAYGLVTIANDQVGKNAIYFGIAKAGAEKGDLGSARIAVEAIPRASDDDRAAAFVAICIAAHKAGDDSAAREILATISPAAAIGALSGMVKTDLARGRNADAVKAIREGERLATAAFETNLKAKEFIELAGLALKAGDRELAFNLLDTAWRLARDVPDPERRLTLLERLANIEYEAMSLQRLSRLKDIKEEPVLKAKVLLSICHNSIVAE